MFFSPSFKYFLLFPDPYNHVKEVFLRSLTSWGIDPYSFISASILSSDLSCLAEDSNRMIQVWMPSSLISIQYPRLDATGSTSMSWYVCFYAHGWSLFFVGWVCLPLFHTPRMIIIIVFLATLFPTLLLELLFFNASVNTPSIRFLPVPYVLGDSLTAISWLRTLKSTSLPWPRLASSNSFSILKPQVFLFLPCWSVCR